MQSQQSERLLYFCVRGIDFVFLWFFWTSELFWRSGIYTKQFLHVHTVNGLLYDLLNQGFVCVCRIKVKFTITCLMHVYVVKNTKHVPYKTPAFLLTKYHSTTHSLSITIETIYQINEFCDNRYTKCFISRLFSLLMRKVVLAYIN